MYKNKGFILVYGLMILLIVLPMLSITYSKVENYYDFLKNRNYELVFMLHHANQFLLEQPKQEIEDTRVNEEDDTKTKREIETINFNNHSYQFEIEKDQVLIKKNNDCYFLIHLDEQQTYIKKYEYFSSL